MFFFFSEIVEQDFLGKIIYSRIFFFRFSKEKKALPISKQQKSYPKDSMDSINFIKMSPSGRHTKTCFNGRNQSLYEHTKEEETHTVCSRAYETVYVNKPSGMHPNNTTGTIAKATRSRSLEKTTSKYMAQPWAQSWKWHLVETGGETGMTDGRTF